MKKTSRRTFGKQLTGAVAALPLVGLDRKASAVTGHERRTDPPQQKKWEIRSHQDTPPPVIIEEGSIKVDVKDQNLGAGGVLPAHPGGGYRWEFPKSSTSNDIFLVGIKIVTGADRLLFYLDRDFGTVDRQPIIVRIHVEGPDNARQELVLSTEGKYVTLKVPPRRELKKLSTTDPPSVGRLRFRYHDEVNNTNYPIKSVAIATGAGQVISRIDPSRLPEGSSGLKIMLWFEDVND
jgi:hypothetical protein